MGSFAYAQEIPTWVKTNASWWLDGTITDREFASSIAFLVKENIIEVSGIEIDSDGTIAIDDNISIPEWIRNNVQWWIDGEISEEEFKSGIQFMIKEEIISFNERETLEPTEHAFIAPGNVMIGDEEHVQVKVIDTSTTWSENNCLGNAKAEVQWRFEFFIPSLSVNEVTDSSLWEAEILVNNGESSLEQFYPVDKDGKVTIETMVRDYVFTEVLGFTKKSNSERIEFYDFDALESKVPACNLIISSDGGYDKETGSIRGHFHVENSHFVDGNSVVIDVSQEHRPETETSDRKVTNFDSEGFVYFEHYLTEEELLELSENGGSFTYWFWIENDWAGLPEGGNLLEVVVQESNSAIVNLSFVEAVEGGYNLKWHLINSDTGQPISNQEVRIHSYNPEKNIPPPNERTLSRFTDADGWLVHPITNFVNSAAWTGNWEYTIVMIPESQLIETPSYAGDGDVLEVCLSPPPYLEDQNNTCVDTTSNPDSNSFKDSDKDGIADDIDTKPNEYSNEFSDLEVSKDASHITGKIIDKGGHHVKIWKDGIFLKLISDGVGENKVILDILSVKIELDPLTAIEFRFG